MTAPDVYERRRHRLMSLTGAGLIIIPPHPYLIYANDSMIKYRPHSNTIYFSGISQHDTLLIMDANQFKSFLFILDKDPQLEQWHGRRLSREEAGEISGVELVYYLSELEHKIPDLITPIKKVFFDFKTNIAVDGVVRSAIKETDIEINPLQPRIDHMRLIKDSPEIEIIRKSVELSIEAHMMSMRRTRPGITEAEIENIFADHFRVNGGILPSYEANVSSGHNSLILHHHATRRAAQEGEMILVDCGAEYEHYTADIARTWPVSGSFTDAQRRVYQIVLETNKECIEMVKPGMKFWDIQSYAVDKLVEGMLELGLLNGDKQEIIDSKEYRKYFPHSIGHFLGMDGHDTPTIDRKKVILQPGMYVTIEPGLYINDDDHIPPEFHNIGIRIEDNILVTKDGHENLSISLPKEIEEVEQLVGSTIAQ